MPRAKKTAGTAVDKRNGQRALDVVGGLRVERFEPPAHVCEQARDAWDAFWDDRQAALLTPSAKVVLLRWVDALDRYIRITAEADASPLVQGSQQQPVMNPAYRAAQLALDTVETCEKQLGIGGINAAALGIAAITEQRSLRDMNARYGGDAGGGDAAEEDPRLRIIPGEVEA